MPADPWTAVVLAGGRSRRFGTDKTHALLHGRTLLDLVVDALPADVPCVVAGPRAPGARPSATLAIEPVPHGGPVAGLAAALPLVPTALVGVVAADMPFAVPALVALIADLAEAPDDVDGVVSIDASGAMQQLVAAYRREALADALAGLGDPYGRAMRDVIALLNVRTRTADRDRLLVDIDTAADLAEAARAEEDA